jgi:hypothetical protein
MCPENSSPSWVRRSAVVPAEKTFRQTKDFCHLDFTHAFVAGITREIGMLLIVQKRIGSSRVSPCHLWMAK